MKYLAIIILSFSLNVVAQKSSIDISTPDLKKGKIVEIVNFLGGEGMLLQGIKTNQDSATNQLGYFVDSKNVLGMHSGIVMSTGSVRDIGRPSILSNFTGPIRFTKGTSNKAGINLFDTGSAGDLDLENELGGAYKTFDACVVELDVIPLGDTLSFKYLFASEEYDEFVGTGFNDAFAFYLSGPGIEKPINLALLKNGSRVSVNSINNGNPNGSTKEANNPSFYNKNNGQIPLEFDGFTRVLEVKHKVSPFHKYHLKLVIADAGDRIYDSGVFTESESLISYDHIYTVKFNTDNFELSQESKEILLGMSKMANAHEEYMIELTGHTDNFGNEEYNMNLANQRLLSVADFLLEHECRADNIKQINKGETMPIATNTTAEGRRQNRRVEIKLIPTVNYGIPVSDPSFSSTSNISILAFPNPAKDFTKIKVENATNFGELEVVFYDVSGKLIEKQTLLDEIITINTSQWQPGIYTYALESNGKTIKANKMVVVH